MTVQGIPVHTPDASDYPQVYDGQGRRLGLLDNALAVMVTETLITPPDGTGAATGEETLTFLLPTSDPKRGLLENERRIRVAGSEFVVRRVVDGWDNMQSMASQAVGMSRWMADNQGASGAGVVTTMITGEAAWYDLASCDPIPSLALTGVPVWHAIVTVLAGSGWTFAGTDIKQPSDFSIGQPTTVLAALRLIQQTWGGELQFDSINKTVGLWRQRGEFCQVVYAYRHNMVGDTRTLDTETLATRAWAYGAGNMGLDQDWTVTPQGYWVVDKPYVEDYSFFDERGWPRETRAVTLVNDQITDPAQLRAWATAQLALLSQPKPTYELVVAQLPTDPLPAVGDTVTVDDSELPLRTQPRVVQRVLDVLQPTNTQLQLANTLPALPTASNPAVGGAPTAVSSNGSIVLGDGSGNQTSQGFYTAPQGSNPNVWMDGVGVHATRPDGTIVFNLSALSGIVTAQAVLQDGSLVPAPVITGQIVNNQISDNAITETKITDTAIDTPKLAANAVTAAKIAANTITTDQIAANTIQGYNIAAYTITGANILATSITADKLNVAALSAISANLGTVTAGTISGVTINGTTINGGTINGGTLNGGTFVASGGNFSIQSLGDGTTVLQWDGGAFMGASSMAAAIPQTRLASPGGSGVTNATFINLTYGVAPEIQFDIGNTQVGFISSSGYNGQVNPPSDARLKAEVAPLGSRLAAVRRLRGVSFRWKDTGRPDTGLVAQEVREVLPELVVATTRRDGSEHLGINLMGLNATLVEAVKDLAARVDELIDSYVTGHPMVTLES